MDSQSDPKTRKSPDAEKKVRIIEDELGHQVFSGTIKTVKLTLMNTGVTFMSEEQQRLMKLAEAGIDDARNDVDEDLEIIDDSTGFDPYDSTKK
jgi:ribonuclease PH